jgi:hypothetical protein
MCQEAIFFTQNIVSVATIVADMLSNKLIKTK